MVSWDSKNLKSAPPSFFLVAIVHVVHRSVNGWQNKSTAPRWFKYRVRRLLLKGLYPGNYFSSLDRRGHTESLRIIQTDRKILCYVCSFKNVALLSHSLVTYQIMNMGKFWQNMEPFRHGSTLWRQFPISHTFDHKQRNLFSVEGLNVVSDCPPDGRVKRMSLSFGKFLNIWGYLLWNKVLRTYCANFEGNYWKILYFFLQRA